MFAVSRKFLSLGYAISRYTWASVSNPLMARIEWPNATIKTTKEIWVQKVPPSQPVDSFARWMFDGVGGGGRGAPPRRTSVSGHQIRRITTITVVICMMRRALVLDSGTPLMFDHQK